MPKQSFTNAKVKGISPVPPQIKANKEWGRRFSNEWGVALPLPHGNMAAVFLDKRLISRDYKTVMQVFGKQSVPGYVISCEGKEWVIEAEPTKQDCCGLIMYTKKRKALGTGTVTVKKTGEWHFTLNTLYPGIRNKKKVTFGVQGGSRGGTGQKTENQVAGTATVHF
ncbi:MAG: hypothetical protein WA389_06180 [Terriglobales bacterium]